jgi:hypothetical protein
MKEKGLPSKYQTVWFEKNKNSLNLKFKPYNISWTVNLSRISFKLPKYIVSYCSGTTEHCSNYYSDDRGVTLSRCRNKMIMQGNNKDKTVIKR